MGIFDFLKRDKDSSSQPQNVVLDPAEGGAPATANPGDDTTPAGQQPQTTPAQAPTETPTAQEPAGPSSPTEPPTTSSDTAGETS